MAIRKVTAQIRKLPGWLRSMLDDFFRSLPRETSGMFLNRSGHHYWAAGGWFFCAFVFTGVLFFIEPEIDDQGDPTVPGHTFALLIVVIISILLLLRRFVAAICRVTGEQAQDHDPWRADRLGVAALLLLTAPAVYLGLMLPGAGLADAEIPVTILVSLFAVAIFSDWAKRPLTLAKTLRAHPQPDTGWGIFRVSAPSARRRGGGGHL